MPDRINLQEFEQFLKETVLKMEIKPVMLLGPYWFRKDSFFVLVLVYPSIFGWA